MVRVLSNGALDSGSQDGSFGAFGLPSAIRDALELQPGDTAWIAKRRRAPEVTVLRVPLLYVFLTDSFAYRVARLSSVGFV